MKLLKNYFTEGLEEAEALADVFHKYGEEALEANYKGQAEAYQLCLSYYASVEEDLEEFIEGIEYVKAFYKKVYMVEEDSISFYRGFYHELALILSEIK